MYSPRWRRAQHAVVFVDPIACDGVITPPSEACRGWASGIAAYAVTAVFLAAGGYRLVGQATSPIGGMVI